MMAVFPSMQITELGQALYNKAQAGVTINFTKMKIGSGQLNVGQDQTKLTTLIDYKFDIPIGSIKQNTQLQVAMIAGYINNSAITTGTYICELGLFAQDPDVGEILYAYTNAGTQGDYYAPASSGPFAWSYQINAAIGNASNVTATLINSSLDYSVESSSTFVYIEGVNQKEINESIDSKLNTLNESFDEHKADHTTHFNEYATDTGTANTYVINPTPAITAYAVGQIFKWKATNANTGASTLNASGKGAKSIVKNGSVALASGDILAGQMCIGMFDGTNIQFIPMNAVVPTIQTFASSGTWTKPLGASIVKVVCIGAGGGGGGGTNGGVTGGGGGGGGAYAEAFYKAMELSATETIVVGLGGSAGSYSGNGGNGGTSSFGTTVKLHAYGGAGGLSGGSNSLAGGGGGGTAGTGNGTIGGAPTTTSNVIGICGGGAGSLGGSDGLCGEYGGASGGSGGNSSLGHQGGSSLRGGGGGGGGAGTSSTGNGGNGGTSNSFTVGGGGAGGTSSTVNGTNGGNGNTTICGSGGGGGAITSTSSGTGGIGGAFGGGGGGGGSSPTYSSLGGKGGDGGVIIYVW